MRTELNDVRKIIVWEKLKFLLEEFGFINPLKIRWRITDYVCYSPPNFQWIYTVCLVLHQWSVYYSPSNFQWIYIVCFAFTSMICLLFSTKFSMNLYWPSFNISDLSVILHQIFNEFILSALLLHQWSVCYSQPNYQWFYSVCLASASVIWLLFSNKFSMNLYCLSCFYISNLSVFLHQIFNEHILSALHLHYSPSHFQWILLSA